MWLAHYRLYFMVGWASAVAYQTFITTTNGLVNLAEWITFIGAMACLYADVRHVAMICTRCAREFPLDGAEQAERRVDVLRAWHTLTIAGSVAQFALLGLYFLWLPAIVFALIIQTGQHWLNVMHRRLMPWCPWCKGWNHGDDAPISPPVPTGEGTR